MSPWLVLLVSMLALTALPSCAPAVHSRPCPAVTEFPVTVQQQAAAELRRGETPALAEIITATNRDRAANRAICQN